MRPLPDVVWMVIQRGLGLTAAGAGVGLLLAFGLARALAGLFFGVSAHDFGAFASVSVALAAAALTACYIPARRAARTDPTVALRYE